MADTYLPPADPLTRRKLAAARNSLEDMVSNKMYLLPTDPLTSKSKSLLFQKKVRGSTQSQGSMAADSILRTPLSMNGSKNAPWDKPQKTPKAKLTNIFPKQKVGEAILEECKHMTVDSTYLPPADPLTRRQKTKSFQKNLRGPALTLGNMVVGGLHRKPKSMNGSKNASWDKPPLKTQPDKPTNIFLKKAPVENSVEDCNIAACGDVELLSVLTTQRDPSNKDYQLLHQKAELELNSPKPNALSESDMAELCQIEQTSSMLVNSQKL